MGKVIRLTENDLVRLVKKIIKEQKDSVVILYDDFAEKKPNRDDIVIDGIPKRVGANPTVEVSGHILGYPERKGKLRVDCDSKFGSMSFFEKDKITVNGHNKKMADSFCSSLNIKPNLEGEDCLIQGGFKKKSIGGPMTKREVYSKVIDGKEHQLTIDGSVRIINGDRTETIGKWKCDMSSPSKVSFMNLKKKPIMYN